MVNWYTADPHFGHENIMKFCRRPFRTTQGMDDTIIRNMRALVGPEDDLWILGDFADPRASYNKAWLRDIFDHLPGKSKHFVIGNHDNENVLTLPWDSVHSLVEVRDGSSKKFTNTLCHYPMITWNHSRRGGLQLFGHVHNNWLGSRNSINVGVDVWGFKPVRFKEIEERAKTLPILSEWRDAEPASYLS